MLKDLYKYLSMMFVAVFAAACSELPENLELPDSEESRYIIFENFDVETKVTNDNITTQEFAIWVFDKDHQGQDYAQTAYIDGSNYRLKYHEGRWRFYNKTTESYEDIEWGNGKHVFLAFSDMGHGCKLRKIDYANPSNSQFNFVGNVDLRTNSLYQNDLLCCVTSVETVDYKPVKMQFNHVLSSLKFVVHNNSGAVKTISGFNLNSLQTSTTESVTILKFSAPTTNVTWSIQSIYSADYKYLADDVTLADGESCVMFGGPVAVYPQEWNHVSDNIESGFNKPKLTMTIDGVETVYSFYADFGLSSWAAGRLYAYDINIGPLSPTVTVQHVKTDGVLTHSAAMLSFRLAEEQLGRIRNMTVTISDGDVVYKTQTYSTVTTNSITVTEGPKKYLPQGDTYKIDITYELLVDGNYQAKSTSVNNVTSPAPPAYSVILDVTAQEEACTIDRGEVQGISADLLAEVNLTYDGEYALAIIGGSGDARLASGSAEYAPGSSTFVTDFTFSGTPTDNGYQIVNGLKFDGVSPAIEYDELTDCANSGNYITYIPPALKANVGDYFYQNGTFSSEYVEDANNPLVGIVFYVPDEDESTADTPVDYDSQLATACTAIGEGVGTHGLVVAVTPGSIQKLKLSGSWGTVVGYNYMAGRYDASYIMTGYTNTTALLTKDKNSNGAQHINEKRSSTEVTNSSLWYYPTFAELDEISDPKILETINNKLTKAGKAELPDGTYWSVTEAGSNYTGIFTLYTQEVADVSYSSSNYYYTLPILAF